MLLLDFWEAVLQLLQSPIGEGSHYLFSPPVILGGDVLQRGRFDISGHTE